MITPAARPIVVPSRLFAGPTQYPPKDFAAYGIVAFKSRATKDDDARYEMICNAYISSLLSSRETGVPLQRQMATVWPVDNNREAINLNEMSMEEVCRAAVSHYGLRTSLNAIEDAGHSNARVEGIGPFLLAWSPSETKGQAGALVLVSDLSDVTTTEQAKQIFYDWRKEIQENPALWEHGWNLAKVRRAIQLWADKYGSSILQIFGNS